MHVIVDDKNKILRFVKVPLFGNKVELMACFYNETDALRTLYEVETGLGLQGHRVVDAGDGFYTEEKVTIHSES
jgi:hypothetical protein